MKPSENSTVEALFNGRPDALRLFQAVQRYIESIGPVKVRVTKTQVSFIARIAFAWVWLPQIWVKKRLENSITLSFGLDHRITDGRIAKAVEPYPGRWMHHVVIEGESDFDEVVRGWLREAYLFSGGVYKA